jgi:hypothetical protein
MASLHILRRSDTGLLHIDACDDPIVVAAGLSTNHAFEVTPVAVFPGLGGALPAVRWILGPELKCSWYNASISEALAAIGGVLEEDQEDEPPPKRAKTDLQPDLQPISHLPPPQPHPENMPPAETLMQHVELCTSIEADKACDITKALKQKVGDETARRMLLETSQVSAPDETGRKRRVLKLAGACARGEALRLKG